jgi:tRNA G10  N-methylase Trm11
MTILEESIIRYDETSTNFSDIMEKSISVVKRQEEFLKTKIDNIQAYDILFTKLNTFVDSQLVTFVNDHKKVLTENNVVLKELNKLFKYKFDQIESKVRAASDKIYNEIVKKMITQIVCQSKVQAMQAYF